MAATRLLVLSCSRNKRHQIGLMPAVERYDGPSFRVLRKFQAMFPVEAQSVDVHILSAEFGLVPQNYLVPAYDHRMTLERATELRPSVVATFRRLLTEQSYEELFISAGNTYLQVLKGYEQDIPSGLEVTIATGSPGGRLSQLYTWLNRDSIPTIPRQLSPKRRTTVRFRGVELHLTPDEISNAARLALESGEAGASRHYQAWYVLVAEQRVAPKWLVSELSGIPVSSFTTGEAVRVLTQLGVEVRRV